MRFNFDKKEMIIKIVFFGPSLGGKTTTLRAIYAQLEPGYQGTVHVHQHEGRPHPLLRFLRPFHHRESPGQQR